MNKHPMPRRAIQTAALVLSLAAHAFVLSFVVHPAGAGRDDQTSDLYQRAFAFAAQDSRHISVN